jgi:hypothetical protein
MWLSPEAVWLVRPPQSPPLAEAQGLWYVNSSINLEAWEQPAALDSIGRGAFRDLRANTIMPFALLDVRCILSASERRGGGCAAIQGQLSSSALLYVERSALTASCIH